MFERFVASAILVVAMGAAPADAQSGRDPYVPAELPPESFEGVQYVDSSGCAFIRAGVGGQVNWVPRFDEDRQPVCGLAPSIDAAPRTVVAETQEPTPEPPTPAAQPRTVTSAPPAPTPAPAPITQTTRTTPVQVAEDHDGTYCPNYDVIGQRATRTTPNRPVRCGPQPKHPVDGLRSDGPGGRVWAPHGGERPMPEGYRVVWKDDRLNPNRGQGTPAGEAQMKSVWTQTVPRELIHAQGPSTVPYSQPKRTGKVQVSTKGAAVASPQPAPAPVTAAGHRFVQVGSFGVPSNAADTAARFERMGLPVQTSQVNSNGRTLRVVLVGPFASAADLNAALRAAREAGFGDAFTRG